MRTRKLLFVRLSSLAAAGAMICAAASNTQVITVEKEGGKLTISKHTLEISPADGTKIRWKAGKSGVAFRIEFEGSNPCDPSASKLDASPAVCVVPVGDGKERKYKYKVVPLSNSKSTAPAVALVARTKTCDGCKKSSTHHPKP